MDMPSHIRLSEKSATFRADALGLERCASGAHGPLALAVYRQCPVFAQRNSGRKTGSHFCWSCWTSAPVLEPVALCLTPASLERGSGALRRERDIDPSLYLPEVLACARMTIYINGTMG